MSKVTIWIGNIFIVLVILTLALCVLAPRLLGISLFTVYSGSMSPAISVGSVVVTQPIEASDIKVGDVIAFETQGGTHSVVVHRVVKVINDNGSLGFLTAGDANNSPDSSPVLEGNVIGRMWFHLPFLGHLTVRTKPGFVLFLVVPVIAIILLEVKVILNEIRAMKKSPR